MTVDDHGNISDTLGGLYITNITEADSVDDSEVTKDSQQKPPDRHSFDPSRCDNQTRSFRIPPPLDRHRSSSQIALANGKDHNKNHRASQLSHRSMSSVSCNSKSSNRHVSPKDDWADKGAAVIYKIEKNPSSDEQSTKVIKKGVKDFNFGRTLGEGSYSTVVAATDRQTLKEYAIKILDKRHIIKEKKVKYVNIEKNTLNRLGDHPGIVSLYYTFQDERSLFYVLDLAANGELLGVLKTLGSFNEECTRYYGAQILDALDYMHTKGIIHRDLKPENILLDECMHIKITDFGTAKILDKNGETIEQEQSRANSFVGTAEYVSPELLTDKAAYKSSDLWAFGCIIYQLLSGRPPFKASNEYQTFQKIVHLDYSFPLGFPPLAKNLVSKLLVLDPKERLTIAEIKKHEFFANVEWGKAVWKSKPPTLRPHRPDTIIRLSGHPSTSSLPIFSAHSSISTKTGNIDLRRQSSEARLGTHAEIPQPPSTLDLEWTHLLLHNERILRFGNVIVPSGISSTLTPNKLAKRFLQRKKQRTLLITNGGRAFFVYPDKKVKAEIELTPATMFFAKGKTFTIETPDKTFVFEDPVGRPFEWIEKLEEAKMIACKNPLFNGSIKVV